MSTAGHPRQPPPPVVTLAARYGAGGPYVGSRVAQRLGVSFLDRAIITSVASRTGLPEDVVIAYEEKPRAGVGRLFAHLSKVAPLDAGPQHAWDDEERRVRVEVEKFLAEASVSGGVALGRGANFVLRDVVPGVLCVLLTGSREVRVQRAIDELGLDRATAQRDLELNDEARLGYVRRNYGAEREAPEDYHVIIDSTVVDLDTVVETIVAMSAARGRQASLPAP